MSRKHQLHEAVGNSALGLVAVIATLVIAGCGGSEPKPAEDAAVDPRFASAESLVDYYNEISFHCARIDPAAQLDLFYAENETQEQIVRILHNMIPYVELQQAVWEHFDEGLSLTAIAPPLAPNLQPARITEHSDQRAQAEEVEADGTQMTLYLVQIDNRWWISAYTAEYAPGFAAAMEKLDVLERNTADLAVICPSLTAEVKSGGFGSVTGVRAALYGPPG
jgi:hypothetical protein